MATIATSRLNRLPAAERGITIGDFLAPIRLGERISSRARHIMLVVAGALLIYLSAQISIRLPDNPVPITGQTFGVLLVGGALGYRRGLLATLLYIAVGLVGAHLEAGQPAGALEHLEQIAERIAIGALLAEDAGTRLRVSAGHQDVFHHPPVGAIRHAAGGTAAVAEELPVRGHGG